MADGFTTPNVDWFGNSSGPELPISGSFGNADAGTWDTTGGSGTNWGQVAKALQQLQGTGGQQGAGVQNLPGAGNPTTPRPNTGVPAHAGALTALLQMLNQRRDLYLNAAMNPQAGPVQQGPPGPGLLGV